jgi:hypothetical protein
MHICSIYTTHLRIKVSLNLSCNPLPGSRRTKPDNAHVTPLTYETSLTDMQTLLDGTNFFLIRLVGGGVQAGPLGTSATEWLIVPAPGDYDGGEFGEMKIGRGNQSTRRKPAPAPLCPPQIPLDQTRAGTRAAAVGSQRLTA